MDRNVSNTSLAKGKRTSRADFVDRVQVVEEDRYAYTLISPPLTNEARVVDASMIIERVFDVDTVTQTFGVQVSVMMSWLMPYFEEPKPPEQDDGDWEPEWTPKYKFKNLMENIDESFSYFPYEDENDVKRIMLEAVHVIRVYEQMELESFPVDCQDLTLELVMKQTSKDIFLQPLVEEGQPSFHLIEANCFLNDFTLMETPCVFAMYLTTPRLAMGLDVKRAGSYGKCVIGAQVKLERMQTFYVSNVIGVLFPIASFALSAWALHPADIEGRLAVDFQLILTAVAFKLVLNGMTPNVSYLTVLDVYVLGCFAFLSFVTIYHAAFPSIYGVKVEDFSPLSMAPGSWRRDESDLVDWDFWCLVVFMCIWGIFNLGFTIYFQMTQHGTRTEFVANAHDEVDRSQAAMAKITQHVVERDVTTALEYQYAATVHDMKETHHLTAEEGRDALLSKITLNVNEKLGSKVYRTPKKTQFQTPSEPLMEDQFSSPRTHAPEPTPCPEAM